MHTRPLDTPKSLPSISHLVKPIVDMEKDFPALVEAYHTRILLYGIETTQKDVFIHAWITKNQSTLIQQAKKLVKAHVSSTETKKIAEAIVTEIENTLIKTNDLDIARALENDLQHHIQTYGRLQCVYALADYQASAKIFLAKIAPDNSALSKQSKQAWQNLLISNTPRDPHALYHTTGYVAACLNLLYQFYLLYQVVSKNKSAKDALSDCIHSLVILSLFTIPLYTNSGKLKKHDLTLLHQIYTFAVSQYMGDKKLHSSNFLEQSELLKRDTSSSSSSSPSLLSVEDSEKKNKPLKRWQTASSSKNEISDDSETDTPNEEIIEDIKDGKGSTYIQLKHHGYARFNFNDLKKLHPEKEDAAIPVISRFYTHLTQTRIIPPPATTEKHAKKSPFFNMDGKIRLKGSAFRLALVRRDPTPEEQERLEIDEEIYSPRKIIQHNRGGY